jgi:single-strand DNA-binding protein
MTIPTQMSLHGFIASAPQLNFTGKGTARFYACVGVEHFRKEPDDTFTRLDPTYHDLVMFGGSAERAYARFKVGDQLVASGYIHEYELDKNGTTESREEFVARRIGHDLARTRYAVDRNPSRQSDPPAEQVAAGAESPRAVSI